MKSKVLIVFLFILFAIPIPIAVLGSLLTLLWFISSVIKGASFVETLMALLGVIIGGTYIVTYIYSLIRTREHKRISFKTFLPVCHCLIACLFLLLLTPVGNHVSNTQKYFGFEKRDFTVVEELDTHGGFHGDGSYYLILDCSNNKKEALEKIKEWEKLPLSENLELIMYGGEREGITYGYKLAQESHIPQIKNGYYIFKDRHSESTDSTDDTKIFDRYSFNFSIAIYDCDSDKMYYFEFDT